MTDKELEDAIKAAMTLALSAVEQQTAMAIVLVKNRVITFPEFQDAMDQVKMQFAPVRQAIADLGLSQPSNGEKLLDILRKFQGPVQ